MRTRRLRPGESLALRAPCSLTCCAGSVWIQPQAVLLTAGESYSFAENTGAIIRGYAGIKDEWLNGTGIIVVALW